MKSSVLFRSAAVLLLLFAAGHTIGFLTFRPSNPEGLAVLASMNHVRLDSPYTYGGFYKGFGLFITVFLIFSAWLAWWNSSLAVVTPAASRMLGWAMVVTFGLGVVLSLVYFGTSAVVMSCMTFACLLFATIRVPGKHAAMQATHLS